MARTAAYYDRVSSALGNLTQQLNVNADRDLQREQLGLKNLQDTQTAMMQLEQQRQSKEMHETQLDIMKAAEERAKSAEGRAETQFQMSLPGLKFNNLKFKNAMEKSPVSIGKWFSANPFLASEVRNNPEIQQQVARLYGEDKIFDTKTFTVRNQDGSPVMLSGYDQANKGVQLLGLAEAYIDPTKGLESSMKSVESKINSLQKQYKNVGDKDVATKAQIISQISSANEEYNTLSKQANPINLLQFYRRKDALLRTAATIASNNLAEPAYINLLSNAMSQNAKTMQELQKQIYKDNAGGGTSQQHYAVKLDDQGLVQDSVIINAPKNLPKGISPGTIDPQYKDYVWAKQAELIDKLKEKSATGQLTANQEQLLVEKHYGTLHESGQYIQTPETIRPHGNAQRALADIKENEPQLSPEKRVIAAIDWSDKLEKDYKVGHSNADQLTKQEISNILRSKGKEVTEENVYRYILNAHEIIDKWYLNESYIKEIPERKYTDLEVKARNYFMNKKD